MDQCSNCKFVYHMYYDGDLYLCRRYPPVTDYADDKCRSFQPEVDEDDWCAEYKKRKGGLKQWVRKLISSGATQRGTRPEVARESRKDADSVTQK